jgi:hypothetical protein
MARVTQTPLPKNTIDETGHRYGRLVVTAYAGTDDDSHALWTCVCDCGNTKPVRGAKLRSHRVISCGCERADPNIRQAARLHVSARRRKQIADIGAAASKAKRAE